MSDIPLKGSSPKCIELSEAIELCDACIACNNPSFHCIYLPVVVVYLDDELVGEDAEKLEDAIAELVKKMGFSGRVEAPYTTGNTTCVTSVILPKCQ